MSRSFNWKVYTAADRQQSIERLKKDIGQSKGDIIQFNMFSDLQLNLMVEIKEHHLLAMANRISEWAEVGGTEGLDKNCTARQSIVFLNVSFAKGSGTLEQDIPKVPG